MCWDSFSRLSSMAQFIIHSCFCLVKMQIWLDQRSSSTVAIIKGAKFCETEKQSRCWIGWSSCATATSTRRWTATRRRSVLPPPIRTFRMGRRILMSQRSKVWISRNQRNLTGLEIACFHDFLVSFSFQTLSRSIRLSTRLASENFKSSCHCLRDCVG